MMAPSARIWAYWGPALLRHAVSVFWVSRLLFEDDMKVDFLVVCTNVLAYVTNDFVPIIVWMEYSRSAALHVGFTYTACLCTFGLIMTTIAWQLSARDEGRKLPGHAKEVGF